MSHYQKVFIISLLCVAVIFLSGVLLPKLLSRQIFEIRYELKSQNDFSKYSLKSNVVPVARNFVRSESEVFMPSQTVPITEVFPNVLSNSIQIPSKIKKRRKRQAVLSNQQFVWNFNLNLTEKRNPALPLTSGVESENKDKHLDIAIYNKGEASRQNAFNDIQLTLRLAEGYFKELFKRIENGTAEGDTKRELVNLANSLVQFDADGSGDEPLIKGREGKFFNLGSFNIFGFRKSPKEKTSLSVSTLPENDSTYVEDELITAKSPQIDFKENSQMSELSSFQAESLVSGELNSVNNISSPNLPGKTEDGDCIDCNSVGFDLSTNSEYLTNYPLEAVTSSSEITDEILEVFCTRLVDKMILEHLPDTEDINDASKNSLNIKNSPKNLALNSHEEIVENESSFDFFSENFVNSNSSESELRQKKFLNFGNLFGLGSGRAADEQDEQNILMLGLSDIDLKKLPTLVDCENFFKRKNPMSFKQSVMNEIYTENMNSDVSNTNSKIAEQEILRTEPNDLNFNNELSFKSTHEVQPITEMQKEGRFFGGLGFGSGNSESRSLDFEEFVTRNEALGSGDLRAFEAVDLNSDKIEFGSGNSRSLWGVLFGNRNEFGSGDSRSLDETSGIQTNEFESGDSFKDSSELNKDLISTSSKPILLELQGLGSGDARDMINLNVSHNEHKCGNNCSFGLTTEQQYDCNDYGCDYGSLNENDMSEDDSNNEWDCHENCSNVSVINTRGETENNSAVLEQIQIDKNLTAENFQRSISSDVTFNIESVANKSGSKIETVDRSGQDCLDCNHEDHKVNKTTIVNYVFYECDECNSTISEPFDESEHFSPSQELEIDADKIENLDISSNTTSVGVGDHIDELTVNSGTIVGSPRSTTESTQRLLPVSLSNSGDGKLLVDSEESINLEETTSIDIEKDRIKEISKTQNVQEQTTERNDQRFLRPIFLTGSGDGGLFEDSGGVINLLEEEETTFRPKNISSRLARLDQFNLSVVDENSLNQSKQKDFNSNVSEQNSSTVPLFRRRGRMDDRIEHTGFTENNLNNSHDFNNKDTNFETKFRTMSDKEEQITNETASTVSVNLSNDPVLSDLNKESRFQPIPCIAARECNATLNERCITINSSKVCGCSRGYARNKQTGKCIVKKIVETSIKLPAESFEDDLKNPLSPNFQRKQKSSVEMMWWLLKDNPELLRMLSDIDAVKFSPGSLIVTLNLVFAAENKSEAELVKYVEDGLQITLRNEKLVGISLVEPLNISDASLISVNGEIDYCKFSELNYCSEDAYCVSNALLGSYTCHCKERYRDESFDPQHIGETCLAKCPPGYCGANGYCEPLMNGEKICLCTGLYFGRKCEVPGLYVFIIVGFLGFISITMLLLIVFKKRCSRFSYQESQGPEENRAQTRMDSRVSDAIALEENIGATKMVAISTPKPDVTVKITRPTVTESGSSYEFDSTFDSTPGVERMEENPA